MIVGRAFLDLHCLTTYDAVQQIDEGAFVVVGIVLAVPYFFPFSPISTMRRIVQKLCQSSNRTSGAKSCESWASVGFSDSLLNRAASYWQVEKSLVAAPFEELPTQIVTLKFGTLSEVVDWRQERYADEVA